MAAPGKRKQAAKAETGRLARKGRAEERGKTTEGSSCLGDAARLSLDCPRKESEGSILITPTEGRTS